MNMGRVGGNSLNVYERSESELERRLGPYSLIGIFRETLLFVDCSVPQLSRIYMKF